MFLGDHFYDPPTLTVRVGTTVTWRVVGQQVHDVIASGGSFRAIELVPGSTFAHTFTTRGRFPYFCAPHYGDGMRAEIVVE